MSETCRIHLAVAIDYDHGSILASDVEVAIEDKLDTGHWPRKVEATAVVVSEGLHDRLAAVELESSIHDIRARADKGVRDALVEQTRSIVGAADNLSGALDHCVALLALIDEARGVELPRLDGVVGSGREAVAAWHAIKPAVEQTLTALDD